MVGSKIQADLHSLALGLELDTPALGERHGCIRIGLALRLLPHPGRATTPPGGSLHDGALELRLRRRLLARQGWGLVVPLLGLSCTNSMLPLSTLSTG